MLYTGVDFLTIAKVVEDDQAGYKAEAPALIEVSSVDIPEDGSFTNVYKDGEAVNAYAVGTDEAIKISTKALAPDFLQRVLNGVEEPAYIDTGLTETAFYALGFRLSLNGGSYSYWSFLKGTISIDPKTVESKQGTTAVVDGITFRPLVTRHKFTYNGKPCRKLVVNDRTHKVDERGWLAVVWTPDNLLPIPAPAIELTEEFDRSVTATITTYREGDFSTYTLDGTPPTVDSEQYSKPFKVARNSVIKAVECSRCRHTSEVAVLDVSERITKKPVLTVVTLYGRSRVSMVAEQGARIYYTLDGTPPTVYSPVYKEAIELEEITTVKAFAKKDGFLSSDIVDSEVLPPLELPIFSFVDDIDSGIVTITEATKGAVIEYAIDNGDFVQYNEPVGIDRNCTIRARAVLEWVGESEVAELVISTLRCKPVVVTKSYLLDIEKIETPTISVEQGEK